MKIYPQTYELTQCEMSYSSRRPSNYIFACRKYIASDKEFQSWSKVAIHWTFFWP